MITDVTVARMHSDFSDAKLLYTSTWMVNMMCECNQISRSVRARIKSRMRYLKNKYGEYYPDEARFLAVMATDETGWADPLVEGLDMLHIDD